MLRASSCKLLAFEKGSLEEEFKKLKVWAKTPDAKVGGLHWREHCRGLWPRSDGEMKRFLQIARGSAGELEYHLLLARDLELLSREDFVEIESRVLEVQKDAGVTGAKRCKCDWYTSPELAARSSSSLPNLLTAATSC